MTYEFYTTNRSGYPDVFPPGLTSLHGYFTVGDLPTNAVNYSAPISDWLFADGVTTVTPDSDYSITRSEFTTNELGELTDVWVTLWRNGPYTSFPVGTNVYMNLRQSLIYDWTNQNELAYCYNPDVSSPCIYWGHYPAGDGYVTLRAVPLPGSLVLLITGFAALGVNRLHRRRTL